jgi:GH15 family glucan-1,4-alpha-glucosidase
VETQRPFNPNPYPPIEDYALVSDCESTALVGRHGSIDWCCMPSMDAASCFGRLLDWRAGGHCSIAPAHPEGTTCSRHYVDGSMVLATCFQSPNGRVVLHDFFVLSGDPSRHDEAVHLARLARCESGELVLRVDVVPRFDYGTILPDIREARPGLYTACGSNQGLVFECSAPLTARREQHAMAGDVTLRAGESLELSIRFLRPELLHETVQGWAPTNEPLAPRLEQTLAWWTAWEGAAPHAPHADPLTRRSAVALKALCFERTGAIAAAATTSLPEAPGGVRNWDYRFSWIRDSVLAVRALHALGFTREAARFSDFIERSAAGNAHQLQLMYGLDGRRRLTEITHDTLEGWRGARPVRTGNAAADQTQLDIYGSLLELAWLRHDREHPMDAPYWHFLVDAVDVTCQRWREPDHGIWEVRDAPRHFVHSKAMCWVALDRGIRLAQRHGCAAPLARWSAERDTLREDIDRHGYDDRMGVYHQSYGVGAADASLLLLPHFGYIAYDDPRMVRTTDWIVQELDRDGLLLRYASPDGLPDPEGAFVACTFWLAECLAKQGRAEAAERAYARAAGCANDLGLFAEEFGRGTEGMLGNFPQALTHLSQISARLALEQGQRGAESGPP